MTNKVFVTGAAGFLGFHLCKGLINQNIEVVGFDNINDYYEISLKEKRLDLLNQYANQKKCSWRFIKGDLENKSLLNNIFKEQKIEIIYHLAAQAGVRYSLINPKAYINSNLIGFQNIIDIAKDYSIKNFIFASSSSVYGGNTKLPFSEIDPVNHPVSLYAATKRSNELIAHSYSHLYNLPCTGLRFFTVYGPWGRPDMAPIIFAKAILEKQPLKIFNDGNMYRDFTYIDDVINAMLKLLNKPAKNDLLFQQNMPDPSSSWANYKIFNVGNSKKVSLMYFIQLLEKEIGKESQKIFLEMQPGDVQSTYAETKRLEEWIGFKPTTTIEIGIKEFVKWFKFYYQKK